ncbi:MAG: NUDIX hydrolase [Lachnospiraceae bacterium]|nr:NUDIX hydrolase [Lachnospiraceae bacterium]
MPSFLKDISAFYGDNGRNPRGDNLEEFLEKYNHGDYETPAVTADNLIFRMKQEGKPVPGNLELLMIRRKNHPCIHWWALPGGFVEIREDALDAAARELWEETCLTGIPLEQLSCAGEADRDPRWRIVTIAFLALVEPGLSGVQASDDAADAAWMDVSYETVSENVENGRRYTRYRITLTNEEKAASVNSVVEVSENISGYIKGRKVRVVDNNGIAFDHARFILEGIQTLERRANLG